MHSYMSCHTVSNVKMDFTRQYCYVATGIHVIKYDERRYTRVVSCECVHISFTYDALYGVGIMAAGIHNADLTALCFDKYWTRCGPVFGLELEIKKYIIVRAFYGLP